jgi:hypothetical protein
MAANQANQSSQEPKGNARPHDPDQAAYPKRWS